MVKQWCFNGMRFFVPPGNGVSMVAQRLDADTPEKTMVVLMVAFKRHGVQHGRFRLPRLLDGPKVVPPSAHGQASCWIRGTGLHTASGPRAQATVQPGRGGRGESELANQAAHLW